MAFAGFLRSGEFTWDTPNSALLRRHVVFNKDSVTLTLPSSKTDPFGRGVAIQLALSTSPLCPVSALRNLYSRFPRDQAQPLFSRTVGPFNRQYFVDKVRELLLRAGIATTGYSGHSLRKGAAVSAAAIGISREDIKLLGRWKSDAVDIYINEVSAADHTQKLLQLNNKLHTSFSPPKLVGVAIPSLPSSLQHLRLARRDLQRSPRGGVGGVRLRKRPVNGCIEISCVAVHVDDVDWLRRSGARAERTLKSWPVRNLYDRDLH